MLRPGLMRFILAALVICYHLSQSLFFGSFAVGCFFILSGYWISLMFEKKYSKKQATLKVYYTSRFWRLIPVFYTFCFLGIIVNLLSHSLIFYNLSREQKLSSLVSHIFIVGYAQIKAKILVPAWSLDIEMQFYLLFPLIAYIIGRNKKLLYFFTMIFFIIAILIMTFNNLILFNTSLTYLYLFFIGIVMYHYNIYPGIKCEKISLVILFTIIIIQYIIPALAPYYRNGESKYYTILSVLLILFAIPSLINSVHRVSNERDRFLGEMSFLIYLSHWVWIGPYNIIIRNGSKFSRIPYVFAFLFVTFLSAYLVYRFIDRPSERLRHKWINLQT